jgi:hypothetical protein
MRSNFKLENIGTRFPEPGQIGRGRMHAAAESVFLHREPLLIDDSCR